MSDLLKQTITVQSFLVALVGIGSVLIMVVSLFWSIKTQEAVSFEKDKIQQKEFAIMKNQLNRIEKTILSLTGNISVLEAYHPRK